MKFSIFSCEKKVLYTTEGNENLTYGENLGIAVEKAIKDNVSLKYADLRGGVFEEVGFEDKNFDYVNFDGTIFHNSEFYCCSFQYSSFRGATIENSNFSYSDFYCSEMNGITINFSDLRNSSFIKACLQGGDFTKTKINSTDFRNSDLTGAWFKTANFNDDISHGQHKTDFNIYFENADLTGVRFKDDFKNSYTFKRLMILPEEGSFIGWKKCKNNVIVKLLIPQNSDRINTTKRNCRAAFVEVLDVIGGNKGISFYDENVIYETGIRIHADEFDSDWKNEETHGIHFFLTKQEAEIYKIDTFMD